MLRINAVSDAGYYLTASGEWDRTGAWEGKSADRLGIAGTDDPTTFRRLMANRTPDGSKLTPRDHPDRRLGYDLTFSEPKSVSILRELAGDDRFEEARQESVREVMRDLVEPLAATRERRLFGNHPVTTGNLAWTAFHHRLGRPIEGMPDMNGHTHVVIPNATESRGRFMAIEIRPIMEAAPLIQAAWHANFSAKLKGLGYEIRPTKDAFEIEGITPSMIVKFSRRTAQVEAEQARRECDLEGRISRTKEAAELEELYAKLARVRSPKAKAGLGAKIRELKGHDIDPEVIRADWASRLTPAEHQAVERTHGKALGEPPMGITRLYRVEPTGPDTRPDWIKEGQALSGHAEAEGRWFVQDQPMLDWYREDAGRPTATMFVDVPTSDLEKYRVANVREKIAGRLPSSFSKDPQNEFFLPRNLADTRRPIAQAPRDAEHLELALSRLLHDRSIVREEELVVASLKAGVGEVTLPGVRSALDASKAVRCEIDGVDYVTTPEAMRKEKEIVRFAETGGIRVRRSKIPVEPRPGERLVPDAEKLGFEQLHAMALEAKKAGEKLLLVTEKSRLYTEKGKRGEPLVWLEDVAGLNTGQVRPLKVKAKAVARQVVVKVKRHLERVRLSEFVKSLEVGDVGPRQAERGWSR